MFLTIVICMQSTGNCSIPTLCVSFDCKNSQFAIETRYNTVFNAVLLFLLCAIDTLKDLSELKDYCIEAAVFSKKAMCEDKMSIVVKQKRVG